jgi:hypothetical protein
MLLCFISVAGATVNRVESFGMGKLLSSQISVATCALECGVRRGPQRSRIEGGRDSRLPLSGAGPGFVATQARLASRQRLGLLGAQGHSKKESNEARRAESDQKALCSFTGHTICPGHRPIVVEFHSTLFGQQFACQRNSRR